MGFRAGIKDRRPPRVRTGGGRQIQIHEIAIQGARALDHVLSRATHDRLAVEKDPGKDAGIAHRVAHRPFDDDGRIRRGLGFALITKLATGGRPGGDFPLGRTVGGQAAGCAARAGKEDNTKQQRPAANISQNFQQVHRCRQPSHPRPDVQWSLASAGHRPAWFARSNQLLPCLHSLENLESCSESPTNARSPGPSRKPGIRPVPGSPSPIRANA